MGRKQDARAGGGAADAVAVSQSTVSELSQLALWMAGTLAGMVSAVLAARTPFFKSVMRRLGIVESGGSHAKARKQRPTREQSLPLLAEAIVGNSKSSIASVFGPPRSAVVMHADVKTATYWQADMWYYPLPKSGPLAMAIEFIGDDARRVEFLRAPEV